MGWKDWPYWLRGGLLLIIFYGTILFIPFIMQISEKGGCGLYGGEGSLDYSLSLCAYAYFLILVIGLVPSFIIGSIIGWIIGKIKNRR